MEIAIVDLFKKTPNLNEKYCVEGWIKNIQTHGKLLFINLNDGSTLFNLQIIYKKNDLDHSQLTTGTAIKVEGVIKQSFGEKQSIELLSDNIQILKICDSSYPIQKKFLSFEYLRNIPHLRHRTQTLHAVNIIKSEIIFAIHNFFYNNNFFQIFTPILTTNECEGGSEAFQLSKQATDFFKKTTLLSVSGQFYCESQAVGFKNVYTLTPAFRSEKSNSSQHLAEFWMLEAEISFSNLINLLTLIEKFLKNIALWVLEKCKYELNFLSEIIDDNKNLIEKINNLIEKKFQILEYSQAIEILKNDCKNKLIDFQNSNIEFGMNLSSEHERYLCEKVFDGPLFVINYPKQIKSFYMKQNEDNLTVAAVDLLIPGIGELIGGSEREDSIEKIKLHAENLNIQLDDLEWYLEIRKYGYYKSSGFGLGIERLIMYLTGINNIKEVVSFPRTYQKINF